jgi:hypothetical protein
MEVDKDCFPWFVIFIPEMMDGSSLCPDELDHGLGTYPYPQYKLDFCGGKHHLEVNMMYLYSVLMTSLPDPLSAMEQSDS